MQGSQFLGVFNFDGRFALKALMVDTIVIFAMMPLMKGWPSNIRMGAGYTFTGCPLMGISEIRFFKVLRMAAPNELIFPKVGMGERPKAPVVVRVRLVRASGPA